jgi:hypothetical protein
MSLPIAMAFEREMDVLRAQESLELASIIALAFGSLEKESREDFVKDLSERAGLAAQRRGRDLSKMAKNEVSAVFAQFGIPVA